MWEEPLFQIFALYDLVMIGVLVTFRIIEMFDNKKKWDVKAPDKICVAPHQIFDYDLEIQEVGHNGAEEYIRKDALLEWANSWLAFKRSGIVLDDGFSYAMEELIKKLNEM